ncbi:unnamed protein product [Penicillium manginii]
MARGATPVTVSFALANYNGAYPNVDKLYENLVVNATQVSSVTLPGLDQATALGHSKQNGGNGYQVWMVDPNSPPPHNGNHYAESKSFRIVAPGAGNSC